MLLLKQISGSMTCNVLVLENNVCKRFINDVDAVCFKTFNTSYHTHVNYLFTLPLSNVQFTHITVKLPHQYI